MSKAVDTSDGEMEHGGPTLCLPPLESRGPANEEWRLRALMLRCVWEKIMVAKMTTGLYFINQLSFVKNQPFRALGQ